MQRLPRPCRRVQWLAVVALVAACNAVSLQIVGSITRLGAVPGGKACAEGAERQVAAMFALSALCIVAFVVAYLGCVEVAKYFFYKVHVPTAAQPLVRRPEYRAR